MEESFENSSNAYHLGNDWHNSEIQLSFWSGEGPSLILIPWKEQALYDTDNYRQKFYSPEEMWQNEMSRAEGILNWPTDGTPNVRPNLGVIFIPAAAGHNYKVPEDKMPWIDGHLSRQEIRRLPKNDIEKSGVFQLAEKFYRIHRSQPREVKAYHPDTQGIFDIAHLLYGTQLFYDLAEGEEDWVNELLDISYNLYTRVSDAVKELLDEKKTSMIHGHGTSQGVYFPSAGVRISEDTATLISPEMIEKYVLPYLARAGEEYGGLFVHYCGQHRDFFEMLCEMSTVKAVDLGNPEMYDTEWLLNNCARTETVLYSRLSALNEENWQRYVKRLGNIVNRTGARCILRPKVFPGNREECKKMRETWHELT